MIREATVADAEAMAVAHVRGWQEAYKGIINAEFLAGIDLGQRTDSWRSNIQETALPNGIPSPTNYVVLHQE